MLIGWVRGQTCSRIVHVLDDATHVEALLETGLGRSRRDGERLTARRKLAPCFANLIEPREAAFRGLREKPDEPQQCAAGILDDVPDGTRTSRRPSRTRSGSQLGDRAE